MNRSLTFLGSVFLSAALLAACNHDAASNGAADSNAGQDVQSSTDPNAPKKGIFGGLFEFSKDITIPEGAPLYVIVDETLASNRNHAGDNFAASLAEPVMKDGKTIIPAGAHVTGRVVDAKDAGRLHVPARLSVALTSVEVSGKSYDIDTDTIGKTGKNHNKRNIGFIGGGAAGGALIGGLAGGGKGALIGSLIGAGAGTAGAAATGKKDISLPAETRLQFRLLRPVTVSVKS
jgi:hypothetical protein